MNGVSLVLVGAHPIAFSSEVDTGSREENASKYNLEQGWF
jgi:hypothetical protein